MTTYIKHLRLTSEWLHNTVEHGKGGSSAFFSLFTGWSKPYPETTGYLIPTLLNLSLRNIEGGRRSAEIAVDLGEWLLSIQQEEGFWYGLLYPPPAHAQPSVFNSAQIMKGLCALHRHTEDCKWLDSAVKSAIWMSSTLGEDGSWKMGNYRTGFNPSYYTQVSWPLLETWALTNNSEVRKAAETALQPILARRMSNGAFLGWGFSPDKPAFTHTIAYTLRGLLECARLLDDWDKYGEPTQKALMKLAATALRDKGRLPGAFHDDWSPVGWYCCLTGNAQTAICLLKMFKRTGDQLLLDAATELINYVCQEQLCGLQRILPAIRGAVAGSSPVWGRYMALRYPNWAAKYHCDALMEITDYHQETT